MVLHPCRWSNPLIGIIFLNGLSIKGSIEKNPNNGLTQIILPLNMEARIRNRTMLWQVFMHKIIYFF